MLMTAHPWHLPGLKELYHQCFGGSPAEIERFFALRYRPEDCFLWAGADGPWSAAYAFSLELVGAGGEQIPAVYVYAVSTLPTRRGQGYSRQVMEYLWQEVGRRGAQVALLVPAQDSLFNFYRRQQYQVVSWVREGRDKVLCPGSEGATPLRLRGISPEEYLALREGRLMGRPHARWGLQQVLYQGAVANASGGGLFALCQGDRAVGCGVAELYDQKVALRELLLPEALLPQGIATVAAQWPEQEVLLRLPTPTSGQAASQGDDARPFAMARCATPQMQQALQGCYFGLALD